MSRVGATPCARRTMLTNGSRAAISAVVVALHLLVCCGARRLDADVGAQSQDRCRASAANYRWCQEEAAFDFC